MSPDKAMIGYLQARIAELEAEVERLRGADAEAQKYARMVYHLKELAKWRNPRQLEKFWKRFDEWSRKRVNPSGDTLGAAEPAARKEREDG